MFFEFFVAGSLATDILLLASLILCFATVDRDPSIVTVTVIGTILALTLFGDARPFAWILTHGDLLIASAIAYFIVGTGWAVTKWWFHVNKLGRIARDVKSRIFKKNDIDVSQTDINYQIHSKMMEEIKKRIGPYSKYCVDEIPPKVSEHKGLIIAWMTWWPISAVWTLINDPIVRLFTSIYHGIADTLQRMSDNAFADVTVVKAKYDDTNRH